MDSAEYLKLRDALDDADEDFFVRQLHTLRDSIYERYVQIQARHRVSREVLDEIDDERRSKQRRLSSLTAGYQSERVALMKDVSALDRENRAERIGRVRDVARFSKEMRLAIEEYESLKAVFGAKAVTREGEGHRRSPTDTF